VIDLDATFAAFPTLETARFVLREITPDDADATFAIMSDPRVKRYFGSLPMTERRQAAERVERIRAAFDERSGVRWGIARRTDGALIGSCGFWRLLPEHARAEVGYELHPEAWGQGVMTEALATVLDFAFATMQLHSVEAQIHPENIASRRVLEKLGFVQEGYFRENYYDPVEGRFTDTAVFSLLAPRR
jgi:[ribosomal protein S5]-alanine N-acetyltransferase